MTRVQEKNQGPGGELEPDLDPEDEWVKNQQKNSAGTERTSWRRCHRCCRCCSSCWWWQRCCCCCFVIVIVGVGLSSGLAQPEPDQTGNDRKDDPDDRLDDPMFVGDVIATVEAAVAPGPGKVDPAVGPVQEQGHPGLEIVQHFFPENTGKTKFRFLEIGCFGETSLQSKTKFTHFLSPPPSSFSSLRSPITVRNQIEAN